MTMQQIIVRIVIGSFVGGALMGIATLLLPRGPGYTALAMALGYVAAQLTYNPTHIPLKKFVAVTGAAGFGVFVTLWAFQQVTGPFL